MLAVRWYLRFGLSYRDLEELLAERGIEVDHVTLYRWVQRFTPLIVETARPCRHAVGGRWFVDETYVKVAGIGRYVYRAVDHHGQVIDVYVSKKRDGRAATRFFSSANLAHGEPAAITTDRSPALAPTIVEVLPGVHHDTTQNANNRVEADHGRLKPRLRPMRGLKRDRTASVVIRGHAFTQNLRRADYELAIHARSPDRRSRLRSTNSHEWFDPRSGGSSTEPRPGCRRRNSADAEAKEWPPRIDVGGVTVFIIHVRALPQAAASKRGTAEVVTLSKHDLLRTDDASNG